MFTKVDHIAAKRTAVSPRADIRSWSIAAIVPSTYGQKQLTDGNGYNGAAKEASEY